MKTVSIGRGEGCNIIVDDEMMSRSHAIIRIPTFGKMEVVDMSKNGTYVNGVRVRPNVPVPVTRKDVVNFAEVYQLDWSTIPDPLKYYKIGAMVVGGLIVLLLVILLFKSLSSGTETPPEQPAVEQVQKPVQTDYEQPSQTKEEEDAQPETPAESDDTATPSNTPEATSGTSNEVIDVYGTARASKKQREAEERARQQKAKAQQKAKEQQQSKPQDTQPSKDKSSDGKKNKTVVI